MKTVLMFLLLLTQSVNLTPHEKLKNSFAYIHNQLIMLPKHNISIPHDILQDAKNLNEVMASAATLKGTGFVVNRSYDSTEILTNEHVCASIKPNTSIPELFVEMKSYIENRVLEVNPIMNLYYDISYEYVVTDYQGNVYKINKVLKTDIQTDLCLINTKEAWGVPLSINSAICKHGDEVLNMSVSGGVYYENAVPTRTGIYNGIIKEEVLTSFLYNKRALYTLNLLPGASGSAVINKEGNLCGNISHATKSLGLSYGASVFEIRDFLK
jgi:S1-C subfamily serine protease